MTVLTKRSLRVVVAVSSLLGCSGVAVHLGPAEHVRYDATKGRAISSKACGFMLAGLIPIRVNTRQKRAHSLLVSRAGSDYVADVAVQESWSYTFAGSQYCTRLTATAFPKR